MTSSCSDVPSWFCPLQRFCWLHVIVQRKSKNCRHSWRQDSNLVSLRIAVVLCGTYGYLESFQKIEINSLNRLSASNVVTVARALPGATLWLSKKKKFLNLVNWTAPLLGDYECATVQCLHIGARQNGSAKLTSTNCPKVNVCTRVQAQEDCVILLLTDSLKSRLYSSSTKTAFYIYTTERLWHADLSCAATVCVCKNEAVF